MRQRRTRQRANDPSYSVLRTLVSWRSATCGRVCHIRRDLANTFQRPPAVGFPPSGGRTLWPSAVRIARRSRGCNRDEPEPTARAASRQVPRSRREGSQTSSRSRCRNKAGRRSPHHSTAASPWHSMPSNRRGRKGLRDLRLIPQCCSRMNSAALLDVFQSSVELSDTAMWRSAPTPMTMTNGAAIACGPLCAPAPGRPFADTHPVSEGQSCPKPNQRLTRQLHALIVIQ